MDFKSLISKMDSIAAKKVLLESQETATDTNSTELSVDTESLEIVKENANSDIYNKLVESFGYIAEADAAELIRQQPAMSYAANNLSGQGGQADTSPGSNTSSYTGDIGNATNDPATTDKPADPEKKTPAKKKVFDPNIQAIQNLFNRLGITDNAGAKINPDGVWGWRTEEAKHNFKLKYKVGSKEDNEKQAYADKIRKEYQWRVIADRDGRTARGGADMSKPKDPAIGEPTPAALKSMGVSSTPDVVKGQGGQADGPPALDVLNKVPNPTSGMEYWVNGSRYAYRSAGFNPQTGQPNPNNGWYKNLDPSDKLQWNANRALSSRGYTGPDEDGAKTQFLANYKKPTATAESAELDRLKQLLKF